MLLIRDGKSDNIMLVPEFHKTALNITNFVMKTLQLRHKTLYINVH